MGMNELEAKTNSIVEIQSSRQAQEVQAAVLMAKRFPRDQTLSITRILEDCKRKSLAEQAMYSYPRGHENVTGPSIRLAETLARSWGNIECGVIEIERKRPIGNIPGESIMQAYCWDLETNYRVTKNFSVKHWRDTKRGSYALSDERDVYEISANNGARRLRACILSVIPADVVEQAIEQCEKTLQGGQGPLIDRVRSMVQFFKEKHNVNQDMIEKKLGHKVEAISETELVTLKKIATSLKDNFSSREDYFDISAPADKSSPPKKSINDIAPIVEVQPEVKKITPKPKEELLQELYLEQTKLGMDNKDLKDFAVQNFSEKFENINEEQLTQLIEMLRSK